MHGRNTTHRLGSRPHLVDRDRERLREEEEEERADQAGLLGLLPEQMLHLTSVTHLSLLIAQT